jgi:ligand-binding sensor domain-containing protein
VCVSPSQTLQLSRYGKARPKEFRLPDDKVSFVFEDSDKALWVGTEKGLVHLRKSGNRFITTALTDRLAKYSFTCATQDKAHIYFGTSTGHLVIFDKNTRRFKLQVLLPNVPINAICSSKRGKLYISSSGKGLSTYDPVSGSFQSDLLPGIQNCYSIYEDKAGRIWIEPEKKGVIKYDPINEGSTVFTQRNDANASSPNKNYLVFEDIYNNLWVSLKGGGFGVYNAYTDKLDYFYNDPASDKQKFSNIVTALYSDETGILWLSANDGGVNKITFPGSNFRHSLLVKNTPDKSENEVRAMYEDRFGRLWLASKAGRVNVYKGEKQQQINFENIGGSEIGKIYSIIEDSKGRIWFATKGQGVVCATPSNAARSSYKLIRHVFDPRNSYSLSSNLVYSVLEDKSGRIWIGTLGGGLNMISESAGKTKFFNGRNAFKKYPSTNKVIRHLQTGPDGTIWVATTDGLIASGIMMFSTS